MSVQTMYPPQKDSPSTYLVGAIDADDTSLVVGSADMLPQTAPFPLTLGFDKSITETVIVNFFNTISGQCNVTRGESPMSWPAGTKCARVLTADDISAIQENITELYGAIPPEEITYSELFEKYMDGFLETGKRYLITDYQTVYVQPETGTTKTENKEPLIVFASGQRRIYCKAISTVYPNDEIWYDINNDSSKYNWAVEEGGKGVIYRRIDDRNNDCPYDHRKIKFVTYNSINTSGGSITVYSNTKTYAAGDAVSYGNAIYYSLDDNNRGNTPSSTSTNWFLFIKQVNNETLYKSSISIVARLKNNKTKTIIVSGDPASFTETLTFSTNARNNKIEPYYDNNGGDNQILNNIVIKHNLAENNYFGLGSHDIRAVSNIFYGNKFGKSACYNIFQGATQNNNFGEYCSYNTVTNQFYGNKFDGSCQNNLFGIVYGNTFGYNACDNAISGGFYYNKTGARFRANIIFDQVYSNTFGNSVNTNVINREFAFNSVNDDVILNTFGRNVAHNHFGSAFRYNKVGAFTYYCSFGEGVGYFTLPDGTDTTSDFTINVIFENMGNRNTSQLDLTNYVSKSMRATQTFKYSYIGSGSTWVLTRSVEIASVNSGEGTASIKIRAIKNS
jgi:hypothetical protein